jgi:transposase-like protein
MNNKRICPACGSENISENKKNITIKEPFAGEENIEIIENTCHACESTGDFFEQNEKVIEENIKELKQRSVENILKYFIKNKRSLTSIERALEIPFRTLAKWKNKITKTSAAGIALLRFIRLFPWLLDVAENKYDPQKAENIMLNNAMNKLKDILSQEDFSENLKEEMLNIGGAIMSGPSIAVDKADSIYVYGNFEEETDSAEGTKIKREKYFSDIITASQNDNEMIPEGVLI